MANIFAGVPWIGIPQPPEPLNLVGNFMKGRAMRREEQRDQQKIDLAREQLGLQRQQEERLRQVANFQMQADWLQMKEAEGRINSAIKTEAWKVRSLDSLSGLMDAASNVRDWSNPTELFNYGKARPESTMLPQWKTFLDMHENARKLQNDLDVKALGAQDSATPQMRAALEISRLESLIGQGEEAGQDMSRAKSMLENLRSAFPAKQNESITTYDSQGNPTVSIVRGGGRVGQDPGALTQPVKTATQERVIGLGELAGMFESLDKVLTKDAVGVRGMLFGEVGNKVVAQAVPEVFRGDVADARMQITTINENLLKSLKAAGPLTDKDAVRLKKALVDMGPIESYESVLQWKSFWKREIGNIGAAKVASLAGKGEYLLEYQDLKALTDQGKIDPELAVLVAFHLGIPLPIKKSAQQPSVPQSTAPPPR